MYAVEVDVLGMSGHSFVSLSLCLSVKQTDSFNLTRHIRMNILFIPTFKPKVFGAYILIQVSVIVKPCGQVSSTTINSTAVSFILWHF